MQPIKQSIDDIRCEFRMNGKDVDYVELDLEGIELDRYAPEARRLIVGLLQDTGLDPEMKIVRPPSKTPAHLPTSTVSLMTKQMHNQPTTLMPMAQAPTTCPMAMAGVPMKRPPLPPPGFSGFRNNNFVQGTRQPYPRWIPNPTYPSPSYSSHVADLTTSMGQIALSQPSYICTSPTVVSSRPIYGNGLSMKPPFMNVKQNRFSNYENESPAPWNAPHLQWFFAGNKPLVSQAMTQTSTPTTLQESPETLKPPISPISLEKEEDANKVANGKLGCYSDIDGTSEDSMSIDNESADSGNVSGELSPRSYLSPKSSPEESSMPTYAAVLNTPTFQTNDSDEAVDINNEGVPDTPKSHHPEGFQPRPWIQKKFYRSSDGISDEGNRTKECVFCKTNGETPSLYRNHVLKDDQGRTVCHVLQKYVCPLCGATGENAHTVKYCPKNSNPPAVSMMATLKSMRSATGNVRMMCNIRRIRATAKRHQKRTATGASSYGKD